MRAITTSSKQLTGAAARIAASDKTKLPSNAALAELLADAARRVEGVRQRALKRAARAAFLWPEEATELLAQGRSLTELANVGPFIAKQLQSCIENPPPRSSPDPLRRDFLTFAEAAKILAREPAWSARLRGDLHMHTHWSDGSGSVAEMAAAGAERDYEYIAIADHSKGLKIAGGIDEQALAAQGAEIAALNAAGAANVTVLGSIELNISPTGEGDMEAAALAQLDLVIGSFHSALRTKEDQTARYLAALRNRDLHILGIRAAAFTISGSAFPLTGDAYPMKRQSSTKRWRSIVTLTART